jgi:ParB family chromosome partitioning protein
MEELTASIKENGILQPLTVRELEGGDFELIAGERRLRAAKDAGLETVPVYILSVDADVEMMEYALVENIQRVDLKPLEKAEGYAILSGKYDLSQDDIAKRVGKSRSAIEKDHISHSKWHILLLSQGASDQHAEYFPLGHIPSFPHQHPH